MQVPSLIFLAALATAHALSAHGSAGKTTPAGNRSMNASSPSAKATPNSTTVRPSKPALPKGSVQPAQVLAGTQRLETEVKHLFNASSGDKNAQLGAEVLKLLDQARAQEQEMANSEAQWKSEAHANATAAALSAAPVASKAYANATAAALSAAPVASKTHANATAAALSAAPVASKAAAVPLSHVAVPHTLVALPHKVAASPVHMAAQTHRSHQPAATAVIVAPAVAAAPAAAPAAAAVEAIHAHAVSAQASAAEAVMHLDEATKALDITKYNVQVIGHTGHKIKEVSKEILRKYPPTTTTTTPKAPEPRSAAVTLRAPVLGSALACWAAATAIFASV